MKGMAMKEKLKLKSMENTNNIKCKCGKILAKRHSDGKIYVWCKECRKEVELGVEPYEPNRETAYTKPKLR